MKSRQIPISRIHHFEESAGTKNRKSRFRFFPRILAIPCRRGSGVGFDFFGLPVGDLSCFRIKSDAVQKILLYGFMKRYPRKENSLLKKKPWLRVQ